MKTYIKIQGIDPLLKEDLHKEALHWGKKKGLSPGLAMAHYMRHIITTHPVRKHNQG